MRVILCVLICITALSCCKRVIDTASTIEKIRIPRQKGAVTDQLTQFSLDELVSRVLLRNYQRYATYSSRSWLSELRVDGTNVKSFPSKFLNVSRLIRFSIAERYLHLS